MSDTLWYVAAVLVLLLLYAGLVWVIVGKDPEDR